MVVWSHESTKRATLYNAAIIVAIVVLVQLGLRDVSVPRLAADMYQNLANVASMNAAVPPNEFNTLAEQFEQKGTELTAREQALLAKEREFDERYRESLAANKRLTLIVLGGFTALFLTLILLNFYFDVQREERHERDLARRNEDAFTTKL